jgi:hypothetical protein
METNLTDPTWQRQAPTFCGHILAGAVGLVDMFFTMAITPAGWDITPMYGYG